MADDFIWGAEKGPRLRAFGPTAPRGAPDDLSPRGGRGARGVDAAGVARSVASIIDHTLLRPDATRREIEVHCREAAEFGFATVCVNPAWVAACARLLAGKGVGVASVVAFPLGATTSEAKKAEARRAIFEGACEVDAVMNIGALKSDDFYTVAGDIEALATLCRECGVLSKVIIEAALLTDEQKVAACTLAQVGGADYVKTSTGFGPGGATIADVALMRKVVGARMGVKAAGGITDLVSVQSMVAAGASRIGTSSGVKIIREAEKSGRRPIIV
jgi:deoxyribose-phosphate aldolase